jgi:hypothetical protein
VYQEEGGGEREENIELFTILIHGREKFPCLWAWGEGGEGEKGYTEMGGWVGGGGNTRLLPNQFTGPACEIYIFAVSWPGGKCC